MALAVGQNSWTTIQEADTYLTDRIGSGEWFDLKDTDDPGLVTKSSLLTSAFLWLMGIPKLELTAGLTSSDVKNAQIESALFLLDHYTALNERRAAMFTGVESFTMSRKKEILNIDKLAIPDYILGILGISFNKDEFVILGGHYDV